MKDTDVERRRVERAVGGDPTALEELKQRYGPAVHAVLLAEGPPGQADELTDEVFRIAATRGRGMREAEAIGPFFLDLARERAARASGGATRTGDMHRILGSLDPTSAEMLVMSLAEGLRPEEIARAVGKTPQQVSEALSEARQTLGTETGRLETMLRTLRWTPPPVATAAAQSHGLPKIVPVAIAVLVVAAVAAFFVMRPKPIEGSRIHWTAGKSGTEAFAVGRTLETGAGERARVAVGTFGHVEVEPYSEVALLEDEPEAGRLALATGRILAEIDAPAGAFVVAAPGAEAVPEGKTSFSIDYTDSRGGELDVETGAVVLSAKGRPEAYVPAGAHCAFAKETGPGVPWFEDAPNELRAVDPGGADVLAAPLAATREKDTLTLFHLLSQVDEGARDMVVLKLVELVPPPASVTAELLGALDPAALAAYQAVLRTHWRR